MYLGVVLIGEQKLAFEGDHIYFLVFTVPYHVPVYGT